MITLVQFPWSPFCAVQRRILEYSGAEFKIINIPSTDRAIVWRWTRHRYYAVPIIRDGKNVLFETDEDSQVIAKYLDSKLKLDLFPQRWSGIQDLLWHYIENDVEGIGFKLNDIYYEEMVPKGERLLFLRHKERKFGRGCIDHWKSQQSSLLEDLVARLAAFDQMLIERPFLLDEAPRFLDFNLYGVLANFLYSGHYELPKEYPRIQDWHKRMARIKHTALKTPVARRTKQ